MDLQTWVSLFALVAGIGSLHVMMKREIAGLWAELKQDMAVLRTELKQDINRVDDRVYALAVGLRPLLETARENGGART